MLNLANKNLTLSTNPGKGVRINGATSENVATAQELLDFMKLGEKNRATASTGVNKTSSRSHSIFIITITQENT